jgi:hypothetical protein
VQLAALAFVLQGCNLNTTSPKAVLSENSITEDKIADDSVATRHLQAESVTTAKLDPTNSYTGTTGTFSGNFTVGGTLGITGASTFASPIAISTTTGAPATLSRIDPTNYATTAGILGLDSTVTASNTAASTEAYFGTKGESIATGPGTTVAGMTGAFGRVTLNAAGAAPTVTTGIGVDSELKFGADGTISNAYGFHTKVTYAPGPLGTLTNYIGLYIENPASGGANSALAGTQYGIVSDGSASINFFRGNVGIGTGESNPTHALEVAGTVMLGGLATSNTGDFLCIDAGGTNEVTMGTTCTLSDRRLKKEIQPIHGALEGLLQLTGVTYFWKNEKRGTDKQIGLIAQDVMKPFPEAVKQNAKGYYSLNYYALLGPVVEGIKELYAKWSDDHKALERQQVLLGEMQKKIEVENLALRAENKALKDRLDKIEHALAQAAPSKAISKKGRKLASK